MLHWVDRSEDGGGEDGTEPDVRITITKPLRTREAVGVGAEGGGDEASEDDDSSEPDDSRGEDLPDEADVLPDVPDAPPAPSSNDE